MQDLRFLKKVLRSISCSPCAAFAHGFANLEHNDLFHAVLDKIAVKINARMGSKMSTVISASLRCMDLDKLFLK